jgi:hypothetical protein
MTNSTENLHNLVNDIKYVTVTMVVYCFTWLEGFYNVVFQMNPLIQNPLIHHYKPLIQLITSLTTFFAGSIYFAYRIKNEKKKSKLQDLEIEKIEQELKSTR